MEKTMSKYRPNNGDLSENPPSPEHLLRGFHGRDVRNVSRSFLPLEDLATAQCIGKSDVIFYLSDKRDPKDPKGEGAQGYMKRFYHDQNPDSYLYVVASSGTLDEFQQGLVELCRSKGISAKAKKRGLFPKGPLPTKLVDLATLEKVDLSIGRDEFEIAFEGYKLFVWDNMRTLMALPIQNGRILDANIYIWASDHTRVNWRGIID
jgi:hypothetical protein